jgi:hypothetical protein
MLEPAKETNFALSRHLVRDAWVLVLGAHHAVIWGKEMEFDYLAQEVSATYSLYLYGCALQEKKLLTSPISACVTSGLNL